VTARTRTLRALVVWAVGAAVLRLSLWAPEVCPELARTEARAAALDAAAWIVENQREDGQYLYDFHRERRESSGDYNLVRHAGVTMSLYQLVRAGELQLLEPADRGLAWMLDRLSRRGSGPPSPSGPRPASGPPPCCSCRSPSGAWPPTTPATTSRCASSAASSPCSSGPTGRC